MNIYCYIHIFEQIFVVFIIQILNYVFAFVQNRTTNIEWQYMYLKYLYQKTPFALALSETQPQVLFSHVAHYQTTRPHPHPSSKPVRVVSWGAEEGRSGAYVINNFFP